MQRETFAMFTARSSSVKGRRLSEPQIALLKKGSLVEAKNANGEWCTAEVLKNGGLRHRGMIHLVRASWYPHCLCYPHVRTVYARRGFIGLVKNQQRSGYHMARRIDLVGS